MSVLMKKDISQMKQFDIDAIITEIVDRVPLLMQIMFFTSVKEYDNISSHTLQRLMPKWILIYGILMQSNFHELSLVQNVITAVMEDCMCCQKVSKFL